MTKMLVLLLVVLLFTVGSDSDTEVGTDDLMGHVDVVTKRKSSITNKLRSKKRNINTSIVTTEIIVTSDPNGDPLRCTVYSDGRLTECVRIEMPEDVERELREQVRIATRSIGIPGLRVRTRPQPEALINIDTMLYAEAGTFERTVNLLGRDVTIRAVPSQFMWHHGDGTTQTTRSPGKSTASSDVAHVYRKPVVGLRLSVDTTWRIEYRVASGPWRELDETLTVSGPVTTLTTREARPILVGP